MKPIPLTPIHPSGLRLCVRPQPQIRPELTMSPRTAHEASRFEHAIIGTLLFAVPACIPATGLHSILGRTGVPVSPADLFSARAGQFKVVAAERRPSAGSARGGLFLAFRWNHVGHAARAGCVLPDDHIARDTAPRGLFDELGTSRDSRPHRLSNDGKRTAPGAS